MLAHSLGSTASGSLLDTLMPTLRDYDENGLIKPSNDQKERVTSFDSFMENLDNEYEARKQAKNQATQRKSAETKKTTAPAPIASAPLTLDGPIQYRDKQIKKKPTSSAAKPKPEVKTKAKPKPKKPAVLSSSSDDDDDEGGETDPSKMVYDEDEAW